MNPLLFVACWCAIGFVVAHVWIAPAVEGGPKAIDQDQALVGLAFVAAALHVALGLVP